MYTTGYAAAMAAKNLQFEDLVKGTQAKYNSVVELEQQIQEARTSLTDAPKEDIAGINENIEMLEIILSTLDTELVKKINQNDLNKQRLANIANGKAKKKSKKNTPKKSDTTKSSASGSQEGASQSSASTNDQPNSNTDQNVNSDQQQSSTPNNNADNANTGAQQTQSAASTASQQPGQQSTEKKEEAPVVEEKEKKKKKGGKVWPIIFSALAAGAVTFLGYEAHKNSWWPFKGEKK